MVEITLLEFGGYVLPISPLDLSEANRPIFGYAVMVELDGEQGFETSLLPTVPLFRLTFGDGDVERLWMLYGGHMEHICAWRDAQGQWTAYTDLYLAALGLDIAL